jgi:hypothetical protein
MHQLVRRDRCDGQPSRSPGVTTQPLAACASAIQREVFFDAWTIPNLVLHDKPARLATCGATVESMCLSFAAIRIAPQRRIGRQPSSRQRHLQRPTATHALHGLRSSRRRRCPLVAASRLIGRPVRSSTEITLGCRASMLQRSILPHSSSIRV